MRTTDQAALAPATGDALVVVDVQSDFVTGTLAVPRGAEVVEPLNRAIALFSARALPVFATRDWHPPDHCSFVAQGGPWPAHCVAGTPGAENVPGLRLPAGAISVLKATRPDAEAYSGFAGTSLAAELRGRSVHRLFVGGLATDYCVLNTVRDAITEGFEVVVLADAVRPVDVHDDDGAHAEAEMRRLGARFATVVELPGAVGKADG